MSGDLATYVGIGVFILAIIFVIQQHRKGDE